jgi:hypothetical protein
MSTLIIIPTALMKFNYIHKLDLLVIIGLKWRHVHKVRFLTTPPPGIISISLHHVSSLVLTIALMVMKGPPN